MHDVASAGLHIFIAGSKGSYATMKLYGDDMNEDNFTSIGFWLLYSN